MDNLLQRVRAALAERYEVTSEAGRGAMAVVYRAVDLRHSRSVAVKVLQPHLASAVGRERFLHEVRLAAGLAHPYVLPVLDSGEADGLLYYIMPFIEGPTLRERLERESQLPVDDALRVVSEIGEALGHAHAAGILHRDVKPSNILLTETHALLADFGIARALDRAGEERLTASGISVGSPAYMSPQQADPHAEADPRDDQYSLACVLYEMLAAAPPFSGGSATAVLRRHAIDDVPSVRTVRPTVPEPVEAAIERAMAKSAADRFETVGEFVAALGGGVVPRARRRSPAAMIAAAGLIGVAGLFAYVTSGRGGGRGEAVAEPVEGYEFAVLPCRTARESDSTLARDLASSTVSMLDDRAVPWSQVRRWEGSRSRTATTADSIATALHARFVIDCELPPSSGDSVQVSVTVRGLDGPPRHFQMIEGREELEQNGSADLAEELLDMIGDSFGSRAKGWNADWFARRDYLAGEEKFLDYELAEADSLFRAALDRDPEFGQVLWRLDQVHRWQWVPDTMGIKLDSLLEQDRDRFWTRDLQLLEAVVAPKGPAAVALFNEMIDARPRDDYPRLVYADELLHRGSLAEMDIRPDSAEDAFVRALDVNPAWIAGWDHLAVTRIMLGKEDSARASLEQLCTRKPPDEIREDRDPCTLWTLGLLERFQPGSPELERARSALTAQSGGTVHWAARGARYANLYDAQLHFGNELISRTAVPDSLRRSGANAVGIALAALGLPGQSVTMFGNVADSRESRLFADMWAVVPAALGLEGFGGYERGAAARLVETAADAEADSLLRARAAWALALRAAGAEDDADFERWLHSAEGLYPRDRLGAGRLATLLYGVEAARRSDWTGALDTTGSLLAYDSIGSTERPFGRAATYVLRGKWHDEAGNPEKALAAWLWHWNTDFEAVPVSVQAVEVDGAFAPWAHVWSARLASRIGNTRLACREARDALYFWGGREFWTDRPPVEPEIDALVGEMNELLESEACEPPP